MRRLFQNVVGPRAYVLTRLQNGKAPSSAAHRSSSTNCGFHATSDVRSYGPPSPGRRRAGLSLGPACIRRLRTAKLLCGFNLANRRSPTKRLTKYHGFRFPRSYSSYNTILLCVCVDKYRGAFFRCDGVDVIAGVRVRLARRLLLRPCRPEGPGPGPAPARRPPEPQLPAARGGGETFGSPHRRPSVPDRAVLRHEVQRRRRRWRRFGRGRRQAVRVRARRVRHRPVSVLVRQVYVHPDALTEDTRTGASFFEFLKKHQYCVELTGIE